MKKQDVSKIEYFIKVAETGSFTDAAHQLYLSHQALSKQIKMLEQEIGAELLERTPAGTVLTEVGRKMYDIFEPLIRQIDAGYETVQQFIAYKKNTVRIGYFSSLSYVRVVAPIVQYLRDCLPYIRIELLGLEIEEVHKKLMEDVIDLAVTIMPKRQEWENAQIVLLDNSSHKIIVSDKHPWYEKECISAEDIKKENLLIYSNRPLDGKQAFLPDIKVRARIPISNSESYMAVLDQGEVFGIVNRYYGRREGNYKLFEMPEEYKSSCPVICAFKRLHPHAAILKEIRNIKLDTQKA